MMMTYDYTTHPTAGEGGGVVCGWWLCVCVCVWCVCVFCVLWGCTYNSIVYTTRIILILYLLILLHIPTIYI